MLHVRADTSTTGLFLEASVAAFEQANQIRGRLENDASMFVRARSNVRKAPCSFELVVHTGAIRQERQKQLHDPTLEQPTASAAAACVGMLRKETHVVEQRSSAVEAGTRRTG